MVVDQCHHIVQMWFWFGALAGHVARHSLQESDAAWGEEYLSVAAEAHRVAEWLVGYYNKLLEDQG